MSQPIEFIVNFEILVSALFESTAGECADYVREHEPGTLAYEWFVDRETMHNLDAEQE